MTQEANTLMAPSPGLRRRRARVLLALALFIGVLLVSLGYMGVLGGNVRTVDPGRVYRSAQLTGSLTARLAGNSFGQVLDRYRIGTVINMRGGSEANSYYRDEISECAKRGVAHIDIPFSARFLPPPKRLEALFAAFDRAAYPVLFHCAGGSDRSGLVGTIYLNEYRHVPLDAAETSQLTWRYGHIAWGEAHAMNDFFELYRKTGGRMKLRTWAKTVYPTLYARSPLAMKESAPDMAPGSPRRLQPNVGRSAAHASGG